MQKLDAKFYGNVYKAKDDTKVPDEEWMVFLVKDNAFPATLEFYRQKCIELGADDDQIAALTRGIERVRVWREKNRHRLKTPDAKGELLLDQVGNKF